MSRNPEGSPVVTAGRNPTTLMPIRPRQEESDAMGLGEASRGTSAHFVLPLAARTALIRVLNPVLSACRLLLSGDQCSFNVRAILRGAYPFQGRERRLVDEATP
jgi:hypothetical protein